MKTCILSNAPNARVQPSTSAPPSLWDRQSVRSLETTLLARHPAFTLMDRAGRAVARHVDTVLRDLPPRTPVACLCGPGNNGGDGLVAAASLLRCGYDVTVFIVGEGDGRPAAPADAAEAWQRWMRLGARRTVPIAAFGQWLRAPDRPAPLVIDALFGIGLSRALPADWDWIGTMRDHAAFVVAVDCPSGLDTDTGAPVDDDDDAHPAVVHADLTVTFLADKPGLHTGVGRTLAGRVIVEPLTDPVDGEGSADADLVADATVEAASRSREEAPNIPAAAVSARARPGRGTLVDLAAAASLVPALGTGAHKGQRGNLLLIGGFDTMAGAIRLAARAAIAAGAGRVSVMQNDTGENGTGDLHSPVDPVHPELMRARVQDGGPLPDRYDVIAIGCGLGQSSAAIRELRRALDHPAMLVADADALNLIAMSGHGLRRRAGAPWIMTPHPLEAARLLDTTVADIERDRIGAALAIARRHRAVVLLKGAGSVVAHHGVVHATGPSGRRPSDAPWSINDSGSPVLASAGTGDVLTGIIAGLAGSLCHQMDPERAACAAACLGCWMHGHAADRLQALAGPRGVPASALAEAMPGVWKDLDPVGIDAAGSSAPGAGPARINANRATPERPFRQPYRSPADPRRS